MNVDETEPISIPARRKIDPWKILAGMSTAVSVATIATLVWTVNKVSEDEPTAAERLSEAAGATAAVPIQPPAPTPITVTETVEPSAQPESVTRNSNSTNWDRSLNQFFPMAATAPPRAPESTPPPQAGMPVWPFAGTAPALPPVNLTPNIMVNPGFSIDAIIGAVSGTAGWVGGGTLNLIGDALVASAMNNQRPPDPLGALSRIPPPQLPPPPQWPRELDVTKIPPPQMPQWPRELDVTKVPPPHVHWDRIIPRF
ncbi:hypothetical protein [Mycolicibacterium iranicum]|uniref:Uncharacterized protein n=1 Tax=Mycolicibacterium iranicum TaxID=912594 RepID=A0A178LPU3_MYCIR|nr:hypothetical protein [Mycolicibacterium iranicum]OAN34606.1 hypothetical protein A4X20_07925 [Mycolicibacterium iranicum]